MEAAEIPMSPPVWGPLNAYVNVGSKKLPCTQMFTVVMPDGGRVTVMADA